ncbi:MAG TPA: hypothetical protein VL283_05915 [Candidatus Baltobacteraceae bacterium]|nr:hypothetical protein [Candidatus Baltobacteraceae bacterium]
MRTAKTIVHQMAVDAWAAGAVLLTLCLILEAVERGFVSRFFNVLWLLLFVMAASLAVMATHPGAAAMDPSHRPAKKAGALLQLGAVLAAVAAWLLLPRGLSVVWRAAASGIILIAALSVRAAFDKNE